MAQEWPVDATGRGQKGNVELSWGEQATAIGPSVRYEVLAGDLSGLHSAGLDATSLARITVAMLVSLVAASALPAFAGTCTVTPSPFWRNTMDFPDDPFRVLGTSDANPNWVKFAILLCDPTKVYFQDSVIYPFHYEFATQELDPFLGMSLQDFNQVSLFEQGQQVVLGTVVMPYWIGNEVDPSIPEYGIQFVRRDPYDPQMVVDLFNLVRSSINADPGVKAFYFPAFEQIDSALLNEDFFEGQGIEVSSPARWVKGNACYSEGWALGDLKFFPSDQIAGAYLAGNLLPEDILLTDGVPADLPYVSGLLTLSPSTPNSHVAILANTYAVPFAHLALAPDSQRAQDLVGRRVAVRAFERPPPLAGCDVRLIDAQDTITGQQAAEILLLKDLPPLNLTPMEAFGAFSANVDALVPSDIRYFGGKAANFGLLRQSIPANSPLAAAFSFDLWNEFLDQMLGIGNSLRDEIDGRLSGYAYPPDFAALTVDLLYVRNLFKDTAVTSFSPALQSAILTALQDPQYGFDPLKKIRFRSSTNVEDSEQFTGAGLYDSKSGCLADDLDGDTIGPGLCDPSENNEKGVFRAIRKVFASFYNDNAFSERLRWGVDESQVGMALLVHHSFPDPIELANGVATIERFPNGRAELTLVTQAGDVSVTNPQDGSIPEVVTAAQPFNCLGCVNQLQWVQQSNLVQQGATVLDWTADYVALAQLMLPVVNTYPTVNDHYLLDFEYKEVAPGGGALPAGGLVIKQVRQVPLPDDTPSVTPFLINDPTEYCTYPALGAGIGHANAGHRLKSRWTIETRSLWLEPAELGQSLFAGAQVTLTDGCDVYTLGGNLPGWPQATYVFDGDGTTDTWVLSDLANSRTYTLRTSNLDLLVPPSQSPILTLRDLDLSESDLTTGYQCLELQVDYADPVPVYACDLGFCPITETTTDTVFLCPCKQPELGDFVDSRIATDGGVTVDASFTWRYSIYLEIDGAIYPLITWLDTTIEGLTSSTIDLTSDFSRTYHPDPHVFADHFIFQPALDPGVPQYVRDELEASGIGEIYLHDESFFGGTTITTFPQDPACAVDLVDFGVFQDCFGGPALPPLPTPPRTADVCLMLFDDDTDGDIDCADWAEFLFRWTGPASPPAFAPCAAPGAPGRLTDLIAVDRSPTFPNRLVLSWGPSCSAGAEDYAIYEGQLGNWYSHLPVDCSDDGADLTEEIITAPGNRYYLVVPINPTDEGSYGTNGDGEERPVGASACVAAQSIDACP